MSSVNLQALIAEFPKYSDSVRKLVAHLETANPDSRESVYDIARMSSISNIRSPQELARVLAALVRAGMLRQFVRVENGTGGGIEDFSSLGDVPDEIHDWRNDVTMQVTPDKLRLCYKIQRDS